MNKLKTNPSKVRRAEIIVGIPSFNEADNIAHVVEQVDLGLQKYFPKKKTVIINVDNCSPDDTKKAFCEVKSVTPKIYISTPKGVEGKGNNFHNLFEAFKKLKGKVGIVVDADLESIKPDWIKIFGKAIKKGNDYATPLYARNEYDGTITNHLVYPVIYGLLGIDLRQPIGGDFAFSDKLANFWLKQKWHKSTYQYGIDIFMTLHAILGGFKVCQANLGTKVHKPSAPKIGPMFSQVTSTLFKNIILNKDKWLKLKKVKPIKICNEKKRLGQPQPLPIDYKNMKEVSTYHFEMYQELLKKSLPNKIFQELAISYHRQRLHIDKKMWSQIVYDLIYAYDKNKFTNDINEALKALYFGRVVSFVKETMELSHQKSEQRIISQAKCFWDNRDYLLKKYRGDNNHKQLTKKKK